MEIANDIEDEEQIISPVVLGETINTLNNKLKIDKELMNEIYDALINDYIFIDDNYHYDVAFKKSLICEKRLAFFDFIIMSVMEDLKIKEIASFDKHFDFKKDLNRIF